MTPDETDVRLRERLVAGDDDALAEVYDRWSPLVFGLALRVTRDRSAAEDVTQEVFVRLWERPEAFDPQRGRLRTWLCMNAHARAVDLVRSLAARARHHAASAASDAVVHGGATVDEDLMWQTETKAVREAVQALPDLQREAVLLAYYGGRTYRQVARDLEIPEGTAKSRLRGALASLAVRLAAEGIIEC
jgi:RNA polymerase sigma factor (sigma-70 family)